MQVKPCSTLNRNKWVGYRWGMVLCCPGRVDKLVLASSSTVTCNQQRSLNSPPATTTTIKWFASTLSFGFIAFYFCTSDHSWSQHHGVCVCKRSRAVAACAWRREAVWGTVPSQQVVQLAAGGGAAVSTALPILRIRLTLLKIKRETRYCRPVHDVTSSLYGDCIIQSTSVCL